MKIMVILIIAANLYTGCAHVISKDALKSVNRNITFAELRKSPQYYQGEMVLLGGVIVRVKYKEDVTLLEIYQTEMNREDRPVDLDVSGGRFLAQYGGFLDRAIYRKGREVTIAGIVKGVKIMKLGEIDYHYPYILIKDIHLWKVEEPRTCDPYPWYPIGLWGMRGPWGPWYYPY